MVEYSDTPDQVWLGTDVWQAFMKAAYEYQVMLKASVDSGGQEAYEDAKIDAWMRQRTAYKALHEQMGCTEPEDY